MGAFALQMEEGPGEHPAHTTDVAAMKLSPFLQTCGTTPLACRPPPRSSPWSGRLGAPFLIALCLLQSPACGADEALPVDWLPEAAPLLSGRWSIPGITVEVVVDATSNRTGAQTASPALPVLGSVVAAPIALLDPVAFAGLPFMLILGGPVQNAFNRQAQALIKVFETVPLSTAVVDALGQQPHKAQAGSPQQLRLRILHYALATRSGKAVQSFEFQEDLCLVASSELEMLNAQPTASRSASLDIRLSERQPGAPAPFCASMARWAADDGRLLGQALAELGELLAAWTLNRAEGWK